MEAIVKKNVLDSLIKKLAEERSYHSRRYDQIAGEDKPVLPDAQIAAQLSAEKVPVEDPDFLPVNKRQLSHAASQMATSVSPDKVAKFYVGLKKLLKKTSEPAQYVGMSETDLMEALRPFVLFEAGLGPPPQTGAEQEFIGDLAQGSTAAVEKAHQRMLDERSKILLKDLVVGDASRVIEAIRKKNPDMEIPKSQADAELSVSFSKADGNLGPEISITFSSRLLGKPIKITHSGGAIGYKDAAGKESVYYLVDPFPFDQSSYMSIFETSFTDVAQKTEKDEEEIKLAKAAKEENQDEDDIPDEKERKKRLATMQKSLSVDLAVRDAVAMRDENPKKLEKILLGMKPSLTLADFDKLSDKDSDEILKQVVVILDKERGPYYAVGEMDYLRNIFSDDSDMHYKEESKEIVSSDPVATGVEILAQTFYDSAIEPVMSYVVEEMLENNQDVSVDFRDIMAAYGFDSYSDFIDAVDDKEGFIDLLTGTTKSILTNDPSIFDNVMPDFGKIRKAVETKGDLSEYEGRMRLLGIEDAGRLRSIFQYLKTPVAFMKAIDTTVRLSSMKGKSDPADQISDPQKLKSLVQNYIEKEQESDPVSLFISNKRILISAGIDSPVKLASADIKKLLNILGDDLSSKLKKSLSSSQKYDQTGELDDEISSAISDFSLVIQPDFDKMGDVKNPAAKPVLEYIKKFVNDVKEAAGNDPVFNKLTPKINAAIDGLLKQKKK